MISVTMETEQLSLNYPSFYLIYFLGELIDDGGTNRKTDRHNQRALTKL